MRKKAKKTRKNAIKNTVKNTILLILLLTLGISTALLAYLHFFASGGGSVSGEWTADVDMTEHAAATAFGWLQDIEAVSVSLEEMESRMQGLTVQVELTLEQTDRTGGNFRCTVLPESYDACSQAAYGALAAAFREILAERLRMAGYTGSMEEEDIEALVAETFGMSTISYLMTSGPALLPSLEDLQAQYEGSGTYETAEGILTRQFDAGWSADAKAEYYTRTDSRLILLEEIGSATSDSGPVGLFSEDYPIMYTLKQTQEQ
ncbi:MAG: hypothetical protein K2N80_00890 [Lachnospiraceae bacterium]|nr:hypothetical protein [Lachnospiraceae bacterium]